MVRLKSVSNEGTYYLVNGWNKWKAFWVKETDYRFNTATLFKTSGIALRSFNHVKDLMRPDYDDDVITIEEVW